MEFRNKYLGCYTDVDTKLEIPTGSWRHQRPLINTKKCSQCGWCYLFCPQGCMADKGGYFEPALDFCKGCGVCASICPASAIVMVREG